MHNTSLPQLADQPTLPNTAQLASDMLATRFILIRCTVRKYGDSRKDKSATAKVLQDAGASSQAGGFTKKLFAKAPELERVRSAYDAIRTYIYSVTLPWVVSGSEGDKRGPRLYPIYAGGKEQLKFFAHVQHLEAEAAKALDDLCMDLETIIARVEMNHMGALFDRSLYPDENELRRAFGVSVAYDAMPEIADLRKKMLPAEVLESIIAQKQVEATDALAIARDDIAKRVTTELDRIVTQLTKAVEYDDSGDTKGPRLHETLVSNLQGLAPMLDAINLSGDVSMASIVERIRSEIVPEQRLKDDWKNSTALAAKTLEAAREVKRALSSIAPPLPPTALEQAVEAARTVVSGPEGQVVRPFDEVRAEAALDAAAQLLNTRGVPAPSSAASHQEVHIADPFQSGDDHEEVMW